MKELTEYQKEFLLQQFFKNEDFAGWRSIATKLLEKGSCIVAGTNRIWSGGIGTWIKMDEAENAVDCTLYTLDLQGFLTSEHYKQISSGYIAILADKKREISQEWEEICNLKAE
jgi:hypothetical protein